MPFAYTLRRVKASPLTNDNVDDNFEYLKALIESGQITNSQSLRDLLSDPIGSGLAVFNTSPVFVTSILTSSTTFALLNTTATTINFGGAATNINIGSIGGAVTFGGDGLFKGDVVAFYTSDIKFKSNVQLITNALAKVMSLRGVTWDWNGETASETVQQTPTTGLIAQDVREVLPEVIREREDGSLAIDYQRTIGLLVEAIKELNKKVERLGNKFGTI